MNDEIFTEDITDMVNNDNFNDISNIIKNCKKIENLVFSDNKKITYIDL